MDAAAEQYNVQKADQIWDELSTRVGVNAISFATRSKSLLLGSQHERVPALRDDMQKQSITPLCRNLLHEVQALLLLMHEQPHDHSRFERLQEASDLAISGESKATGREARQLEQMRNVAGSICQGRKTEPRNPKCNFLRFV